MNVLFLTTWYPTIENPNFGVFVKEHTHAIRFSGHNIVVAALLIKKSNHLLRIKNIEYQDDKEVRTIIIEVNSVFKDFIYYAEYLQYILLKNTVKKLMKSGFHPDIIHSNVVYPAGIFGRRFSELYKVPYIITEHWSRVESTMKIPVISTQIANAYKNAARILPVSDFLKKKISALLPELFDKKFVTVGNVVDSGTFFYHENNHRNEDIRFCAIASWVNKKVPDKLPELFIEALSEFQKQSKYSISLTMIGGGDRIEELKKLCVKKNVKAVFTGYLSKVEIAEYLQKSDYFIHASTIETFGIVTAEALMCGTPVICSDTGALPELINETNGVLCENNPESWIIGLKKLTSKKFNHALIASDISQKYDFRNIGKLISSVYDSVKQ